MQRVDGEPCWPSAHERESVDGTDNKSVASSAGRPASHGVARACQLCQQKPTALSPLTNYLREFEAAELEESARLPLVKYYANKELEGGERAHSH